jgi:hypothetical protein
MLVCCIYGEMYIWTASYKENCSDLILGPDVHGFNSEVKFEVKVINHQLNAQCVLLYLLLILLPPTFQPCEVIFRENGYLHIKLLQYS